MVNFLIIIKLWENANKQGWLVFFSYFCPSFLKCYNKTMILIVGLGNPGEEFTNTRHNLGFIVLDDFQKEKEFSSWREKKKLFSQIAEGKIGREKVVLAKPQTFMNNSGRAVRALLDRYKIKPDNLWVIHDELSLPFGELKISEKKGPAGHKGVQSIIEKIKTKDFFRLRIGASTEATKDKTKKEVVLKRFNAAEKILSEKIVKLASQVLVVAVLKGKEKAMNEFN